MIDAFVYRWTDHKTQKIYIGSHKGSIDDGYICSSKYMLEAYNKRPKDFTREIIAEGAHVDMRTLEAKLLEDVDARKNTQYYNMHNGNGDFYCKGHTEETKRKISENNGRPNLGKKHSEEHKRKISDAQKGRTFSEEHKRKISEAQKGNTRCLGRVLSEDTKRKMSESQKGKTFSEEHKQKLSMARRTYLTKEKKQNFSVVTTK